MPQHILAWVSRLPRNSFYNGPLPHMSHKNTFPHESPYLNFSIPAYQFYPFFHVHFKFFILHEALVLVFPVKMNLSQLCISISPPTLPPHSFSEHCSAPARVHPATTLRVMETVLKRAQFTFYVLIFKWMI